MSRRMGRREFFGASFGGSWVSVGDSGRGTTVQVEVSPTGSPQGRDDPIGIPHYDGTGQWA